MHGSEWLSSPVISIVLIGIGILCLALAIKHRKTIRDVSQIGGLKILDTSKEWILFTGFIVLLAVGIHLLMEYSLHWYDDPVKDIDTFTHALSGMAITAVILNLRLTQNRLFYYPLAIGASWIGFISWEIFEFYASQIPGSYIEIDFWDTIIDLWVDSLGALSICFLCDELTNSHEKPSINGT